ncbi:MAG TPA: radical SAM protein [Nitrospirae bacterium]|nr:radical SAM protein [Nitrospirota bacterium]
MNLFREMQKPRFFIFNTGCIRRAMDVIHIQRYLEENDWILTKRLNKAEMIIIATCGVVRLNEISSLKAIALAEKKKKPGSRIVVTGCLPKINKKEIDMLGKFIMVPVDELWRLDSIISARIPFSAIESPDSIIDNSYITNYLIARSFCRKNKLYKSLFYRFSLNDRFLSFSVSANKTIQHLKSIVSGSRERSVVPYFNINISSGCLSKCSFCATKQATGRLQSRRPDEIIKDFKRGLSKGYKIFQLIAEDTGCYGFDINTDLADLLRKIFAIKDDYKLIIIDCNPQWLIKLRHKLIPLLIEQQDRIQEIFIPIQSGSDRILKSMRRKYTSEDIAKIVKELRQHAPAIAIRTSFIVGYPGETEEDFLKTRKFISENEFFEVTINRYEDRPGTLSSKMNEKVPGEIIEERALILSRELGCHILS